MPDDLVYSAEDVLNMLDDVLAESGDVWWNEFFADRAKPCPFFVNVPDENLVAWFDEGELAWFDQGELEAGRVLELGCGHGRNAMFMAGRGCRVDAIDFSAVAIDWARDNAQRAGVEVGFQHASIFAAVIDTGAYDLVYDSGCFHHIAPHRRQAYVDLVTRALKPGGRFGLVCFRPEGGSGLTDLEVYQRGGLGGGLGYTEYQLRDLWESVGFRVQHLPRMAANDQRSDRFGADFLQVLRATTS